MACEPQELITSAGCLNELLPNQLAAIQTYLLAVMAEVSLTDVNALSLAASCFATLNPNQLLPIQTYLLCQINAGGGGGGGATQVYPLTGSNTPAAVPTGGGVAYNAIGQVWVYSGGSWVLIIS